MVIASCSASPLNKADLPWAVSKIMFTRLSTSARISESLCVPSARNPLAILSRSASMRANTLVSISGGKSARFILTSIISMPKASRTLAEKVIPKSSSSGGFSLASSNAISVGVAGLARTVSVVSSSTVTVTAG